MKLNDSDAIMVILSVNCLCAFRLFYIYINITRTSK